MSRKTARFTQADVARVLRAVQQTGAGKVVILPDGTIEVAPAPEHDGEKEGRSVAREREIVL